MRINNQPYACTDLYRFTVTSYSRHSASRKACKSVQKRTKALRAKKQTDKMARGIPKKSALKRTRLAIRISLKSVSLFTPSKLNSRYTAFAISVMLVSANTLLASIIVSATPNDARSWYEVGTAFNYEIGRAHV